MAVKILIADDHPLIADGIKTNIQKDTNFEVVAIVSNGKEALNYLEDNTVDILLLDIDMPILSGIDCASILIERQHPVKIVMLSMHQDAFTIKKMVDLGVQSYLLKTLTSKELLYALQKVYDGENYFNADVTKAILNSKPSQNFTTTNVISPLVDELTKHEKEILVEICKGLSNIEIAEKLFISSKTVDVHRTNMMRKLDVHNVVALVRFALRNGIG